MSILFLALLQKPEFVVKEVNPTIEGASLIVRHVAANGHFSGLLDFGKTRSKHPYYCDGRQVVDLSKWLPKFEASDPVVDKRDAVAVIVGDERDGEYLVEMLDKRRSSTRVIGGMNAQCRLTGINDSDQMTGTFVDPKNSLGIPGRSTPENQVTRAFRLSQNGTIDWLDMGKKTSSEAEAINESGTIVGGWSGSESVRCGFAWSPPDPPTVLTKFGQAWDISDDGTIIGDDKNRAAIWTPQRELRYFPTVPGEDVSYAKRISRNGRFVLGQRVLGGKLTNWLWSANSPDKIIVVPLSASSPFQGVLNDGTLVGATNSMGGVEYVKVKSRG